MGLSEASSVNLNSIIKPRNLTNAKAGVARATYSATTGSPTVTPVSGKTCVQFTGSGSITISTAGLVEVLVIGGGGGGGALCGGGGGAGGHLASSNVYLAAGTATVTVGAGGVGGAADAGSRPSGGSGETSSVASCYSPGGGGGGGAYGGAGNPGSGFAGGSGGGCSRINYATSTAGSAVAG